MDGSDTWFQSSASTLVEYWECEGNPAIAWKQNGSRQLFTLLTVNIYSYRNERLIISVTNYYITVLGKSRLNIRQEFSRQLCKKKYRSN